MNLFDEGQKYMNPFEEVKLNSARFIIRITHETEREKIIGYLGTNASMITHNLNEAIIFIDRHDAIQEAKNVWLILPHIKKMEVVDVVLTVKEIDSADVRAPF